VPRRIETSRPVFLKDHRGNEAKIGYYLFMRQTASLLLVSPLLCCDFGGNHGGRPNPSPTVAQTADLKHENAVDSRAEERDRMVREQIERRQIKAPQVLRAMRRVPRHLFVPEKQSDYAYEDRALPIENGQTVSQPYIVALMTELAAINPGDTVLEVGTGSGYQSAILAEIGATVFSIEIVEPLAKSAKERLDKLGYKNIHVRHGDGYDGWKEHAPFDAILITAAPPHIPEPLKQQLKIGGRLVAPVGEWQQQLVVLKRTENGFDRDSIIPVIFVPMTGKAQSP
jgi:protein-L-isoaspartate(D-aspartate) O-methyltransferase